MGCWLPWTWLALGMSIPLGGSVVDDSGRPVGGASVWLADQPVAEGDVLVLGTATTDSAGRFQIDRDEKLVGRGGHLSPSVWAYAPDHRVAVRDFKRLLPSATEPITLTLEPTAGAPVRVMLPDGKPAEGARVRPTRIHVKAPRPPADLLDRLAATTDSAGQAMIAGFRAEDVAALDVTVPHLVTQGHYFPASSEAKVVTILPTGRLAIRVTADDPTALKDWAFTTYTTPDLPGFAPATSWVKSWTDPLGLADPRPFAAGRITWKIEPPDHSRYLALPPVGVVVRPDQQTDVTIPLKRSVLVTGTLRAVGTGRPVAGIKVVTRFMGGPLTTDDPITDAEGRFHFATLPGRNQVEFHQLPPTYIVPPVPGSPPTTPFEIPAAATEFTLAPIDLMPAVVVKVRVVDDQSRPVEVADLNFGWSLHGYGSSTNTQGTYADAIGEFTAGGIAPRSEVTISAALGLRTEANPAKFTAGEATDPVKTITIALRRKPTTVVKGRVVGPDGQPVAGAKVGLRLRVAGAGNHLVGSEFSFESVSAVITAADGSFTTPDEVPVGTDLQAHAEASGFTENSSRWVATLDKTPVEVRLLREFGHRTVTGRVLDSSGAPVAGVEVFQSGDGPTPTRSLTDASGRFAVAGVASGPALLFVRGEGVRRGGQVVGPLDRSVDLVATRIDAGPAPRLVARPRHKSNDDRAVAAEFLALAWVQYTNGEFENVFPRMPTFLPSAARIDPDRVAAMIDNQAIAADSRLRSAIGVGRVATEPARAVADLDAIGSPAESVEAILAVQSAGRSNQPIEWSRDLLDQAARLVIQTDITSQLRFLPLIAEAYLRLGMIDQSRRVASQEEGLLGVAGNIALARDQKRLIQILAPVNLARAQARARALADAYRDDRDPAGITAWKSAFQSDEEKRRSGRIGEESQPTARPGDQRPPGVRRAARRRPEAGRRVAPLRPRHSCSPPRARGEPLRPRPPRRGPAGSGASLRRVNRRGRGPPHEQRLGRDRAVGGDGRAPARRGPARPRSGGRRFLASPRRATDSTVRAGTPASQSRGPDDLPEPVIAGGPGRTLRREDRRRGDLPDVRADAPDHSGQPERDGDSAPGARDVRRVSARGGVRRPASSIVLAVVARRLRAAANRSRAISIGWYPFKAEESGQTRHPPDPQLAAGGSRHGGDPGRGQPPVARPPRPLTTPPFDVHRESTDAKPPIHESVPPLDLRLDPRLVRWRCRRR